uniref:Uncharacterized protein n=1 Tax=Strigamia maritima TaxID=126957 RepID=T1J135_STRMM
MSPKKKPIYQVTSTKCNAIEILLGYTERSKTSWTLIIDLRDKFYHEIHVDIINIKVQIAGRFRPEKDLNSEWVYVKQERTIPIGYKLTARIIEQFRITVYAVRENPCSKNIGDSESASESDPDERVCDAKKACLY